MSRKERENMIQFLTKIEGMQERKLMLMTDADVEHIYTRMYSMHDHN
ncbi:BH0509 family protein [Bacillus sp. FJAT-45037]|nr:BH0509 family protein [Bacillus sp. FJAT-45037]